MGLILAHCRAPWWDLTLAHCRGTLVGPDLAHYRNTLVGPDPGPGCSGKILNLNNRSISCDCWDLGPSKQHTFIFYSSGGQECGGSLSWLKEGQGHAPSRGLKGKIPFRACLTPAASGVSGASPLSPYPLPHDAASLCFCSHLQVPASSSETPLPPSTDTGDDG